MKQDANYWLSLDTMMTGVWEAVKANTDMLNEDKFYAMRAFDDALRASGVTAEALDGFIEDEGQDYRFSYQDEWDDYQPPHNTRTQSLTALAYWPSGDTGGLASMMHVRAEENTKGIGA